MNVSPDLNALAAILFGSLVLFAVIHWAIMYSWHRIKDEDRQERERQARELRREKPRGGKLWP